MGPLNFGPNYFPIKNNEKKMIILRLLLLWFLFIVPPKMIPNSKITLILTLLMNLKNFKAYLTIDFPLNKKKLTCSHHNFIKLGRRYVISLEFWIGSLS